MNLNDWTPVGGAFWGKCGLASACLCRSRSRRAQGTRSHSLPCFRHKGQVCPFLLRPSRGRRNGRYAFRQSRDFHANNTYTHPDQERRRRAVLDEFDWKRGHANVSRQALRRPVVAANSGSLRLHAHAEPSRLGLGRPAPQSGLSGRSTRALEGRTGQHSIEERSDPYADARAITSCRSVGAPLLSSIRP